MEQALLNLFENTSGGFAYALVFGILLLCGLGLPIPEDVSLILGGFLVFESKALLVPMMLTGYLGIIVGDSLVFTIGRRFGSRIGTSGGFLARIFTQEKRQRVAALFARHGEKIVMIARFLPGVRAVTYFTAGSVHMRYSHFIFFDSVAALVSAPVFIYLGYKFGGELEQLIHAVRNGQIRVLIGLAVVVTAYVVVSRLWSRWRRGSQEKKDAAAASTVAPPTQPTTPESGRSAP
ncbi:MAG: DedA family protein [Archangiaceae bacterium]|nr:DedA family protein [Archangiaceae bacterium]